MSLPNRSRRKISSASLVWIKTKVIGDADMGAEMKMFKIHADYRKNNPHTNWYYVIANTKKEAKEKFKDTISWLDIYKVESCTEEEVRMVISNPYNYILLR